MKLVVIFPIIFAILAISFAEGKKIRIDIYVEYSCPYSQKFITTQLAPAYNQIKKDFILNFYTMGKSSSYESDDGQVEFVCQHGNFECDGNKLQTCGLSRIGEGNQDKQVDFMICTMGNEKSFEDCCEFLGLDYESIEECKNSDEGTKLQMLTEEKTAPALERYSHIPLIIFNSEFNEEDLSFALDDFEGLCLRKLSEN